MSRVPEVAKAAYRLYLKSNEWYSLRREALKRDSYRCTRCGYIGELQVHHTSYNGVLDMSFTVDQLESICKECHIDVHRGILPMKKDS